MTQTILEIHISEKQLIKDMIHLCNLVVLTHLTERYAKEDRGLKELCYIL